MLEVIHHRVSSSDLHSETIVQLFNSWLEPIAAYAHHVGPGRRTRDERFRVRSPSH